MQILSPAIVLFVTLVFSFMTEASICNEQYGTDGSVIWIHCPRKAVTIFPGTRFHREILWQIPAGKAPRNGWPVVLLSQGSWFPIEFSRPKNLPFGGFNEVRVIRELLDNGYAVVAPRATLNVGWITNLPHPSYKLTSDYSVLAKTIEMISSGNFGPLDAKKIFATGISSGGYNTSRLAITFPGVFRALVIQSASYASCLGPVCVMPNQIPSNHPPTRFLHGARDIAVPVATAKAFYEILRDNRIETDILIDPRAGHGWLDSSPELVIDWFNTHKLL
jgi:pimeloyl-ACP methyl ester carboxylesterase